ncbi:hypothetical protein LSAT2_027493 [Lamellibrachia satsuma]|nr:hypothetical protein LSAT2_027493 [Lamellibrachia satsuma]
MVEDAKPDIIIACETWLKPNINSNEFMPPGYDPPFRNDRADGYGGVMIAIKTGLVAERITIMSPCEMVGVKIQTAQPHPLVVLGVYRPTDNNSDYTNCMCDAISSIARNFPNSPLWIARDTNLPDVNWQTNTISKHQYTKQINELFIDTFTMLGLSQMVTFPTRIHNTLDVFLTNRPSLVNRCEPIPGVSDHDAAVYVNLDIVPKRQRPVQRKIHIWKKADTELIKEDLAKCQSVLANHVPTKLSSQRYNQPWANGKIRNLSRKKKKYYKKAQRTKSDQDMAKYRATKKLVQSECRKAYYQYINSMIGESNQNGGNLKKFWSFIKSKKNDNSGVAPLKKNGIVHSDSQTKADILNTQFSSVFTKGGKINVPNLGTCKYSVLPDITVCETGMRKLLEAVKPHKATGPDAIPARVLKDYAAEIAPVLTLIYQSSLNQGTVPVDLKHAWVIPVYKKGDRGSPSNYRPISLTSISCKTLEHIVHSNFMDHLENLNILTDYQHGFRKHRSCETQLIQTVDDLAKSLHGAGQIDAGTVLGPILFLCYINDLPDQISSTARLFADDCLLYRNINATADADTLQDDIDRLQKWEADWLMEFNPDKCEIIRITNRRKKKVVSCYSIHGKALKEVTGAKYLGVTIDRKLTWNDHIDNITKKANNTRAFLQRNISSCPQAIKSRCYQTFVRPIVEYASTVSDPSTKKYTKAVENVQRQAARFVMNDYRRRSSVGNMLESLEWKSLEGSQTGEVVCMLNHHTEMSTSLHQAAFHRDRSVGEPPSKRPRMDPTLTGGIADIVNDKVTEVGSARPIEDFNSLINRQDEDHFEKACKMMQERIVTLVMESFGRQSYGKALDCLKELRCAAIKVGMMTWWWV